MASFREEASAAAESLARLNREADKTAKGEQKREQERQRSFAAGALGAIGGALGGGATLRGAAGAFAQTNSFEDAANTASGLAISALGNAGGVTGFLGSLAGLRSTSNILERTQAQLQPLEELRRVGVPIPDQVVQNNIDIALEQQKRVEAFRTDVAARLGEKGQDITAEKLANAIDRLVNFLDRAPLLGGGGQQ